MYMTDERAEIGVYGGSGFYSLIEKPREVWVETPYGMPSDKIALGEIAGDHDKIRFDPRHQRDQRFEERGVEAYYQYQREHEDERLLLSRASLEMIQGEDNCVVESGTAVWGLHRQGGAQRFYIIGEGNAGRKSRCMHRVHGLHISRRAIHLRLREHQRGHGRGS